MVGKLLECRYLGCTKMKAQQIGVNAQINARGGEFWRNDDTLDEIEMQRDGNKMFYQVNSKFFRKNKNRIEHLISSYND